MNLKKWKHEASLFALSIGLSGAVQGVALAQSTPPSTTPPAIIDSPAAGAKDTLDEVFVSARRRSEVLQETPVAETAFSALDLENHSVTTVTDLGAQTPSLTFFTSNGDPLTSLVGIRGQRTSDYILSQTPAVGLYIDDVYQGTSVGVGASDLDGISQIEVLKGPQGTLYGRNTTGGAIKITTNLPDYDGYSGSFKAGYGNYDSDVVGGEVNIPIVDKKVAMNVSLQRVAHSGYGYDQANGRQVDGLDSWNGRMALRFDPRDDLEFVLRADYSDARAGGLVNDLVAVVPNSAAVLNFGAAKGILSPTDLGVLFGAIASPTAAQSAKATSDLASANTAIAREINPGSRTINDDFPQADYYKAGGGSLTGTYNLTDDITLKSITAARYMYRYDGEDSDATDAPTLQGPGDIMEDHQLTQELQLSGLSLERKLQWSVGYYYFDLVGNDDSPGELEAPYLNPVGNPVFSLAHIHDNSNSLYGQATYALTDTVHYTTGVRWTTETSTLVDRSYVSQPTLANCNIPVAQRVSGTCEGDFTNSFHNISYTFGLDWDVTNNVMVYGKTSRGFKAGGENQRGSVDGGFLPYSPEIVTDYEIGAKTEFLDKRLRLNLAAYHSDYNDIQKSVFVAGANNTEIVSAIQNAASATIDGLEFEATAKPLAGVTLHASTAYTFPQYQNYIDPATGANLSGNHFQDVPVWQWSLSATYLVPTSVGNLSTTLDYGWQSTTYLYPDDMTKYTGNTTTQSPYGLLNGRMSFEVPEQELTVSVWAKNITNQQYKVGGLDLSSSFGYIWTVLGDPRTFGVQLKKQF